MLSESGAARFIGWTRGGRRALVLSYLADELIVIDAAIHSPTAQQHLTLSGSNPTGIAVTPDGQEGLRQLRELAVRSACSTCPPTPKQARCRCPGSCPIASIRERPAGQGAAIITFLMLVRGVDGVPDQPPVRELGQVALVDHDPLDPVLRRGRILFTSSNPDKYPTLTGSREAACAACHPNGGNDGSAWSTMEGERRTIGLWGGLGTRGWLHASGTHRSAVDFATAIVKERLGGSGLDDDDVHALCEYPGARHPALAATGDRCRRWSSRGRALFDRHCAGCHDGADGGSGDRDPARSRTAAAPCRVPLLSDVGSATDWAHVTLGAAYTHLFPPTAHQMLDLLRGDRDLGAADPVQQTLMFDPRPERARGQFKAGTLVDSWENDVYFHDARFTSLDEVVAYFDGRLGLGLGPDDQRAIVEYLKTR